MSQKQFDLVCAELDALRLRVTMSGGRIWISGNTFPHRDALKALGCHYDDTKKEWCWDAAAQGPSQHKANPIRAKKFKDDLTNPND